MNIDKLPGSPPVLPANPHKERREKTPPGNIPFKR